MIEAFKEFIGLVVNCALGLGMLAIGILVVMYPFTPHFVEEVVASLIGML